MTRRRVGAVLLTAAAACLLGGLLLPPAAEAAHGGLVEVALDGAAFTARPSGPLLDVDGLTPGAAAEAGLGVRSGMDAPGALRLRLLDVHDDDNGCGSAEAAVDRSCGTGGGELGTALVFTLEVATARAGPYSRTWVGSAAQLERGVDAGVVLPPHAERWLRVRAELPVSVGNVIESDTFRFVTRVELSATSGVAGLTVGPRGDAGPPSPSGAGPLAYTGASVLLLGLGVALLLASGAAVLAAGRRPRP